MPVVKFLKICYYTSMLELTGSQKQKLDSLAQKFGIVFVVAFGSQLTGKTHQESDLDLAVLVKKEPDYKTFKEIFGQLSDIFPGLNVDLRFLNSTDPFFRLQVVKNGKLLYGNPQEFSAYKILTNRLFVDDGRKYFPYKELQLLRNSQLLKKIVSSLEEN